MATGMGRLGGGMRTGRWGGGQWGGGKRGRGDRRGQGEGVFHRWI